MKLFGVIGYPIKHSLSPDMFNAVFKHLKLDAIYLKLEVKPENLREALLGAKALGFVGLNVTIPFKEKVLQFVKAKGVAEKIKAVNTVKLESMEGYNTDAYGVVKSLEEHNVDFSSRFLVIGAGGAARAAVFSLVEKGGEVYVTNRTEERGIKLAKEAGCHFVKTGELERLKFDVLINATPLGMVGMEKALPVKEDVIKKASVVFDMVYNPAEALFVKKAKELEKEVIYGYEMLLYQAYEAFKIWNGFYPPLEVMKEALLKKLGFYPE